VKKILTIGYHDILYYQNIVSTTTPPVSSAPIRIDEEKERILIDKFREYRRFKIDWAERDSEGWLNYRQKIYNKVILPMAIKSNIINSTDEQEANVFFTDRFIRFITKIHHDKTTIENNQKLLKGFAFIEYYTTTVVAIYLGLTYEEFYNLPTKDPDKLRMIFDLGEIVHLLINSDIYEQITKAQEEQMKDRAEWRKKVFRN
jgi:hypothetical protein